MILAFDTFYIEDKAKTVCFKFDALETKLQIYSEVIENKQDYISGEFYKKELPCIVSLMAQINLDDLEFIIIDGYVYLDDKMKKGLGAHLFIMLERRFPIIGVAKTNFATIEKLKSIILRGESKKPLYISSIGISLDVAAAFIKQMKGNFRIPDTLKKLDQYTKQNCR